MKVIEKHSGCKIWFKIEADEGMLVKIARLLKVKVKQEFGRNPKHLDLSEKQFKRIKGEYYDKQI